jgi:chromosome segregation ATPase
VALERKYGRCEKDLRQANSKTAELQAALKEAEAVRKEATARAVACEAAAAKVRENEHVLQDRLRRAVEELKRQMESIRVSKMPVLMSMQSLRAVMTDANLEKTYV